MRVWSWRVIERRSWLHQIRTRPSPPRRNNGRTAPPIPEAATWATSGRAIRCRSPSRTRPSSGGRRFRGSFENDSGCTSSCSWRLTQKQGPTRCAIKCTRRRGSEQVLALVRGVVRGRCRGGAATSSTSPTDGARQPASARASGTGPRLLALGRGVVAARRRRGGGRRGRRRGQEPLFE